MSISDTLLPEFDQEMAMTRRVIERVPDDDPSWKPLKLRLTPNLTIDATVNPDFGQVEADPAVLNLDAFEVFANEKRPFFIEGTGLYRMALNCYIVPRPQRSPAEAGHPSR